MGKNKNEIVEIGEGIYQIKYYWLGMANVYCFLILGQEKALMIDTCYSTTHALEYARTVTDLPIEVVNTHGHFDHIGGDGDFEKVYLNEKDIDIAKEHSDYGLLSKMMQHFKEKNRMVGLLLKFKKYSIPLENSLHIDPVEYYPLPQEGYFELGSRKISIIETPGHTQGSICLMDEKTGYFFVGDMACEEGVLLGFEHSTTVKEYLASIHKMKEYYLQKKGKKIIPSHHALPARDDIFERYEEICEKIISGKLVGEFIDDGLSQGKKVKLEQLQIIYRNVK